MIATTSRSDVATTLSLAEALEAARETRALTVECGAIRQAGRIFAEQFPGASAVIIADEETFRVAGRAVSESLIAAGINCISPFIFRAGAVEAEFTYVETLEASLREHDATPIALGSGVINDLVKLATFRCNRAGYMCVATAASMDGYTAFGASITFQGSKQTFNCPAPRAVIADIDVIRRAPAAMTASGYADLAAKVTAGADWILADAIGVEAIESRSWAIAQGRLRESLADPAGARRGDETAITKLVEGLMLGGFAMQCSKSSRPASGAEHQFSHLWDMEHHTHLGEAPSHGFKVGVATLAVTRFYESLLEFDVARLDVEQSVALWPGLDEAEHRVRKLFAGSDSVETAVTETRAKHIERAELKAQLERLKAVWPEVRIRLRQQLLPSNEMERRLRLAGAPTEPEQIGITRQRLRGSFHKAQHIRRRFTVLDVAVRAGIMNALLDRDFAAASEAS